MVWQFGSCDNKGEEFMRIQTGLVLVAAGGIAACGLLDMSQVGQVASNDQVIGGDADTTDEDAPSNGIDDASDDDDAAASAGDPAGEAPRSEGDSRAGPSEEECNPDAACPTSCASEGDKLCSALEAAEEQMQKIQAMMEEFSGGQNGEGGEGPPDYDGGGAPPDSDGNMDGEPPLEEDDPFAGIPEECRAVACMPESCQERGAQLCEDARAMDEMRARMESEMGGGGDQGGSEGGWDQGDQQSGDPQSGDQQGGGYGSYSGSGSDSGSGSYSGSGSDSYSGSGSDSYSGSGSGSGSDSYSGSGSGSGSSSGSGSGSGSGSSSGSSSDSGSSSSGA
jgi:hypothetical protein